MEKTDRIIASKVDHALGLIKQINEQDTGTEYVKIAKEIYNTFTDIRAIANDPGARQKDQIDALEVASLVYRFHWPVFYTTTGDDWRELYINLQLTNAFSPPWIRKGFEPQNRISHFYPS